jgi:ribosomal protein S18 acetylase RimI-like enzyme
VRAVVRYRLDPPPPPGQPRLTDAIGEVVADTAEEIVLDTRRGLVHIPRPLVVATKVVPDARPRRGLPGGGLRALEVHLQVADAWPAMERAYLGQWLLRASRGFTARGNSVVPVGNPGLPQSEALDAVEEWYAARHLPANVTIAGPVGFEPAGDPLGRALLDRGYAASDPSLFLTARLADVKAALTAVRAETAAAQGKAGRSGTAGRGFVVETTSELSPGWLAAYDGYRASDRVALEAIITGTPVRSFAQARVGADIVGVGRLGVTGEWGGIAAMWVESAYRRRGVALAMLAALVEDAVTAGVWALHLQVWAHNAAAIAVYERVGFRRHHAYVNLSRR